MKVRRNIYREKNGSGFRYRVILGRVNGKPEFAFFPDGHSIREMEKRQEEWRIARKVAQKDAPFSSSLAHVSFAEDVDEYLTALTVTAVNATVEDATKDLGIWAGYAKSKSRLAMTDRDWMSAWTHLIKVRKVAETSANKYVSRLRAFYTWCNKRDKTTENPARELPRFKIERTPRAVDYQTLSKLAETFRRDTLNHRRQANVLTLMIFSGMRPVEIVRMRSSWFRDSSNPRRVELRVQTAKHGKNRVLRPLLPQAAEAVREILRDGLWPGAEEKIGAYYQKEWVRAWTLVCGNETRPRPYDCRHSFAARLLEDSKGDLASVSAALGHTRLTTTQIYTESVVNLQLERAQSAMWDSLTLDSLVKENRPFEIVGGTETGR